MHLTMFDHPTMLVPFILLAASFVLGGKVGWGLLALSFWLVVYISLTTNTKIEGDQVVIRIGKPLPLATKKVPLDEIVEVIKMPSASGIRLIEQFQRPWVPVGSFATGILMGALFLHRGEPYGVLWIYISLISLLNYVFRPAEKKGRIGASLAISVVSALVLLYLGHPEFTLGIALYGVFDIMFANENYGQDAIIIRTERERIVLLGDSTSTEAFIREIQSLLANAGGSNVPSS
ncbi:MAG: hypothetical protein J7L37_05360 [Thermococcus sp.]|nr:hypothetical protein [Thermococcus sp.]